MRQTLFTIPSELAGIPLFGFGWLLGIWAAVALIVLGRSFARHGWGQETRNQLMGLGMAGFAIAFIVPVLTQPEGLMIRGYGMMLLISVLAGVGLSAWRAYRKGVDPEIILSLATWLFVAGLIGARAFYVIEYWDSFRRGTLLETVVNIVNLTQGGLVVFGSLLAGGAALIVFIYKNKLPGLALADLIAPGVVLGVALGRVGCFLNGCCYGGISDLPWALCFPAGSPAYIDQGLRGEVFVHGLMFQGSGGDAPVIASVEPGSPAEQAGIKVGDRVTMVDDEPVGSVEMAQHALLRVYGAGKQVSITRAGHARADTWTLVDPPALSRPVHPTQLYSLIDGLLLLFFLWAFEPYKRRDGELTAMVLTIHPIMRFLLEIIRTDELPVFNTGLSISQNISIGIFIAGIGLWVYLLRRPLGIEWPARPAVSPG